MKHNNINLDKNEIKFLITLLENGSKSDAQIARDTKLSKATVHRIRKKLEKEKVITDYIPIIDFDKIGVDMFQVIMLRWNRFNDKKLSDKVFAEWENDPHVIFFANGQGPEFTTVLFTGFVDIHDYDKYFREFRSNYGEYIDKIETLILPSSGLIKTDFTDMVLHILKKTGGQV